VLVAGTDSTSHDKFPDVSVHGGPPEVLANQGNSIPGWQVILEECPHWSTEGLTSGGTKSQPCGRVLLKRLQDLLFHPPLNGTHHTGRVEEGVRGSLICICGSKLMRERVLYVLGARLVSEGEIETAQE